MKTNATIEDLKRIWNLEIGHFYFDKEFRAQEWKKFVKRMKRDGMTVQMAYEYLCKGTRWEALK